MTDETRVLARLDGRMVNAPLSAAVASLVLESVLPGRAFFSWPGKRNYEGMWWSSTVRSHVGFTAMFNSIAREIEKNPSRTGGATPSSAPLAQAWTIWGR